jgi:hypothetical protein
LQGLRKITKSLRQDSRWPGRDLSRASLEYEIRTLQLLLQSLEVKIRIRGGYRVCLDNDVIVMTEIFMVFLVMSKQLLKHCLERRATTVSLKIIV